MYEHSEQYIVSQKIKTIKCLLPNNLTYVIFLHLLLFLEHYNSCLFLLNAPVQSFEIWNLVFKLPQVYNLFFHFVTFF